MNHFLMLFIGLLTASLSGCATRPWDSGRKGLFDGLEAAHRPARSSSPFSLEKVSARRKNELKSLMSDWGWPLRSVQVTSHFGKRGGGPHEGIDLRASTGTPIYAAQNGKVIHSGQKIRGYGKLIIIQHDSGLSSVYAHNSKLLVKKGEKVKKGQEIARAGATGRATGPHLHFEVRDGARAIDPRAVLPSVTAWNRQPQLGEPKRKLASDRR